LSGQHDVHEHQIRGQLAGQAHGLFAGIGLPGHDVAEAAQPMADVDGHHGLVLNDEHPGRHGVFA